MDIKYKQLLLSVFTVLFFALTLNAAWSRTTYAEPCSPAQLAQNMETKTDTTKDPPVESCVAKDPQGGNGGETPDEGTTCAIEKMGWILCPAIETAGKIGDKAFQMLAKTFLETEPELVSNQENGTKSAWNIARNLANIMFIIAFLIIIYSQATGAGINNYGIKKMLPRLIVAAIAVNVSYYICQAMVDLTNIMGYEIQNFMVDTARGISNRAAMPPAGSVIFGNNSPGTLETMIGGVLGVASIVWFLLPFLFVGVGTIVLTAIVIIAILLMRKAFIVLLVVLAPIAFVAYLLPNTERYFQKWLSMFWKLLLVFPVVGLLFGAGQLASAVVLAAGSNGKDSIYSDSSGKCIQLPTYASTNSQAAADASSGAALGTCGSRSTPFLLGIVAAGIAIAPLLAVWSVLKGALNAAGAIGGKIAGSVETYTKKGAEWGTKNTAVGRGMAARKAIKQNYKDQRFAQRMGGKGFRARTTQIAARGITGNLGAVANKANIGAINSVTGGMRAQDTKLEANFAAAGLKIEKQEIEDKKAAFNEIGGNPVALGKAFEDAVKHGDEAGAKAAQEMLMAAGEGGAEQFVNSVKNLQSVNIRGGNNQTLDKVRAHIAAHQSEMKGSNADIYSWAGANANHPTDAIEQAKGVDIGSLENGRIFNDITDGQMATNSKRAMRIARNTGNIDQLRANRILGNNTINGTIKGTQQTILGDLSDRTR